MIHVRQLTPTELQIFGPDALKEWRDSSRVRVPGYQHTPRFKRKLWDGYRYPGKWCKRTPAPEWPWEMRCSRGLLSRILETFPTAALENIPPRLLDPLDVRGLEETFTLHPTLRDYQQEALVRALRERWGKVALATNAGKGAVIALLAVHLLQKGLRVLVLCDEIAVFQALTEEIQKWGGLDPGKVEGGSQEVPLDPLALAMVPTLSRRLQEEEGDGPWKKWVAGFHGVLLDEADKATAATWRRILRGTKNSTYRVGFSGTFPSDPHDSLVLDELMGPELLRRQNLALVERGISARPLIHLHRFDAAPALRTLASPLEAQLSGAEKRRLAYERGVVYNVERHAFLAALIRPGVPTCLVVNRVDHGHLLEEAVPLARFLSGSDSKKVRDEVLGGFQRGEFLVLIVTKILDRGTNRLGHAVDLIFASGEGSSRQTLQRIGRGLRRQDGKEFLFLHDVIDQGSKYFKNAGARRVQLYREEEFDVEVVVPQPSGQAAHPSGPGLEDLPDPPAT